MNTFRARLASAMAATALAILLISGAAIYWSVRDALQRTQDETLLEITRTEIENGNEPEKNDRERSDNAESGGVDESLLVWERESGRIVLERGRIPLHSGILPASESPADRPMYKDAIFAQTPCRALYYPFKDEEKRFVALCVQPSAPMRRTLTHIFARIIGVGIVGASVACLMAWLASARLTRPLEQIAARARHIGQANLSERIEAPTQDVEIVAVTESLNEMLCRLNGIFEAQRRFISDAAHELRSPLANLRITAEVSLRRSDPALRERALQVTLSETERLTALTEMLLTLSRADAGELPLHLAPMDLRDVADSAVRAALTRAETNRVRLTVKGPPAFVTGDPERLRQIIDNLLDNAIRHSPPDGVVCVVVGSDAAHCYCIVRDEGEGIAAADLPHVFERFWRADAARARATGGYGLGLAISQMIARAHGGTLRASNAEDGGAVFTLELPPC